MFVRKAQSTVHVVVCSSKRQACDNIETLSELLSLLFQQNAQSIRYTLGYIHITHTSEINYKMQEHVISKMNYCQGTCIT